MDVLPPEEVVGGASGHDLLWSCYLSSENPECDHYPQLYDFSSIYKVNH